MIAMKTSTAWRITSAFLLLLLTACGPVVFLDPYNGKPDPQRTVKSEGIISAIYYGLANGPNPSAPKTKKPSGFFNTEPAATRSPEYSVTRQSTVCETRGKKVQNRISEINQQLKIRLDHSAASLEQQSTAIIIRAPTERFFLSNNERLETHATAILDTLINRLYSYPELLIHIGMGYLDESAPDSTSLRAPRIENVVHYLSKHGISERRIFTAETRYLPSQTSSLESQLIITLCIGYNGKRA